jgi:hypothetical protein
MAEETIKLLENEGVQENDFYWQLQLTRRNNWKKDITVLNMLPDPEG